MQRRTILSLLAAAPLAAGTRVLARPPGRRPIVIGHRGASGYRPEHTEAAYRLAIAQGADYVEPDLVMTRDGALVARHENEIGRTTDVASRPEFAARRGTRVIEGESFEGWFVEDFTLAELKTLGARERNPDWRRESARHDGQQPVLTFQEIIGIVKAEARARRRPIGLYVELKNPGYHASIGLPMEAALVEALARAGLSRRDAPVFVQSFWPQTLIALRRLTPVKLMLLLNSVAPSREVLGANGLRDWSDAYSRAGLQRIAGFADAVGPEIELIIPRDAQGHSREPSTFVSDAHAAGLLVHAWSVNAENTHLPSELRRGDPSRPGYDGRRGDVASVVHALQAQGVDGLFTDHPDLVVRALSSAPDAS